MQFEMRCEEGRVLWKNIWKDTELNLRKRRKIMEEFAKKIISNLHLKDK